MKLKNPNCICSEGGFFFIYDPFMEVPLETLNLSMDLEIRIAFQNLTTAAKKNRKEKKNPLFFCQLFARTWGGARKSRDVTTEQEIYMLFSMMFIRM